MLVIFIHNYSKELITDILLIFFQQKREKQTKTFVKTYYEIRNLQR